MALGFYHKKLKLHEFLIPLVVLGMVFISVVDIYLDQEYSDFGFSILILVTSFLTISFLFPIAFNLINIDFGNYKNCSLWSLVLVILAYGPEKFTSNEEILIIVKIPLMLFFYLQAMRVLHYLVMKQKPAFGAIWFTKGKKDKFANRTISEDDILFNMLYAGIPIFALVFLIWLNEVYG